MMQDVLKHVVDGNDLSEADMIQAMQKIMSGEISEIEISAFLTALKVKGETVNEITAGAKVMRQMAEAVELENYYTVDTCGTGGDCLGTFNISTAVAFVAAAAGIKIVKHGNRSVSSKCGSADVLESLGAKIDLAPRQSEACVKEVGMGFFFAPTYHKAVKHVMNTRKTLGFRTVFNILGPLANPASAKAQVLGVFSEQLVEPLAQVLNHLGLERAMVVHGEDGLDEISISGATQVAEVKEGKVMRYEIVPEQFHLRRAGIEDIKGGSADENAAIIRRILSNEDQSPKRDIITLNAAAALYVGKKAEDMKEGIVLADELIRSKRALEKLDEFVHFTRAFA